MKIDEVDKLVEPLGWGRDLCHDGDCYPEFNENTLDHEGSYKKFNMTEHGEDGYISYQSLNEIIEAVQPQLTIPKSVADYHEKIEWYMNLENKDWKNSLPTEQEKREYWSWRKVGNNEQIYQIYSAGKALGVELVKVVEG